MFINTHTNSKTTVFMPIKVNLAQILEDREMTLTQLSKEIGIALPNLSILKMRHAKAMRFTTLEAICETLECEPGDILQRE